MSATSTIEWTDSTINPIRARNRDTGAVGHFCEKVSPGCTNCYASTWNERVRPSGKHLIGTGLSFDVRNRDKLEFFLDHTKLEEVRRRRKPTKFFWCDMTDIFGVWVPDAWIDACLSTMEATPQHIHQVLTKRVDRMQAHISKLAAWMDYADGPGAFLRRMGHVWFGGSVENQPEADKRIPLLLQTPAAVRFISAEPLLGPVDLSKVPDAAQTTRNALTGRNSWNGQLFERLNWVIVGGESGPGARSCAVEWIASIVSQCKAANVPVFVKQLGAYVITDTCDERFLFKHKKGGNPDEWDADLRVREFPEVRV